MYPALQDIPQTICNPIPVVKEERLDIYRHTDALSSRNPLTFVAELVVCPCNAPRTEHSVLLLKRRRDTQKRHEIWQYLTPSDVTGAVYICHCSLSHFSGAAFDLAALNSH